MSSVSDGGQGNHPIHTQKPGPGNENGNNTPIVEEATTSHKGKGKRPLKQATLPFFKSSKIMSEEAKANMRFGQAVVRQRIREAQYVKAENRRLRSPPSSQRRSVSLESEEHGDYAANADAQASQNKFSVLAEEEEDSAGKIEGPHVGDTADMPIDDELLSELADDWFVDQNVAYGVPREDYELPDDCENLKNLRDLVMSLHNQVTLLTAPELRPSMPPELPLLGLLAMVDRAALSIGLIGEEAVRYEQAECQACHASPAVEYMIFTRPGATPSPHEHGASTQSTAPRTAKLPAGPPDVPPPPARSAPNKRSHASVVASSPSAVRQAQSATAKQQQRSQPASQAKKPPPKAANAASRNSPRRVVISLQTKLPADSTKFNAMQERERINAKLQAIGVSDTIRVSMVSRSTRGNLLVGARELDGGEALATALRDERMREVLPAYNNISVDAQWWKLVVSGAPTRDYFDNVFTPDRILEELTSQNLGLTLAAPPHYLCRREDLETRVQSSLVLSFDNEDSFRLWKHRGILFAGHACRTRPFKEKQGITQCARCWSFNHATHYCPQPMPKCRICGRAHLEAAWECDDSSCPKDASCQHHVPKCRLCAGPHPSDHHACPKRQPGTKTVQPLSYAEADKAPTQPPSSGAAPASEQVEVL